MKGIPPFWHFLIAEGYYSTGGQGVDVTRDKLMSMVDGLREPVLIFSLEQVQSAARSAIAQIIDLEVRLEIRNGAERAELWALIESSFDLSPAVTIDPMDGGLRLMQVEVVRSVDKLQILEPLFTRALEGRSLL